jgi:hypothetical protein
MEAATLIRPEPATTPTPRAAPAPRERSRGRTLADRDLIGPALAFVLITTTALRIWGIKQGLPYSYNIDEAQHFVPRAISFFSHNLDPNYFLNPPGYSYTLHGVFDLWFGGRDAVMHAYAANPTEVFVVARLTATALGTLSVWLTYLAGARLFSRSAGLVAAAVFGYAFLPIFYSHLALNDVPTLAPVALSLLGIAGVVKRGRTRDYVIAGIGIGLASATKYTGGITLLCLLGAYICDGAAAGWPRATGKLTCGLLASLAGFLLGNPYAVLDWNAFWGGLQTQASQAGGDQLAKLGTPPGSGVTYYLWTFTWGLGWAPSIAAVCGVALLAIRRRIAMLLVLIPAPIFFVIFMGSQQRYFGRWLMPLFPIAALAAGYLAVELIKWLRRARRVPVLASGIAVAVLLLSQSVVTVIHDDVVLARQDTRNTLRAWMTAHIPAGSRVVLEPDVPDDFATDVGTYSVWTANGERWHRYPTWLSNVTADGQQLPKGQRQFVLVDQYERTLRPDLVAQYEQAAYCWVIIGSLQAGRAFANPSAAPQAVAYYRALQREGTLVYSISPFAKGATPVTFNFDWAIDYYPPAYEYPGPMMSVYRLHGGRCAGVSG